MAGLIISVFYEIDNFCKEFIPYMEKQCIAPDCSLASLELMGNLVLSGAMTICAMFHLSGYRIFKRYYKDPVSKDFKKFFPNLV